MPEENLQPPGLRSLFEKQQSCEQARAAGSMGTVGPQWLRMNPCGLLASEAINHTSREAQRASARF